MAKHSAKNQKTRANSSEMVVVTFVDDIDQAREYQVLLQNNDIPTVIKEQEEQSTDKEGIAVMVHENYLDEAHVIVESQGAFDDFYDSAMDEEDDVERADYDDDMRDDNF